MTKSIKPLSKDMKDILRDINECLIQQKIKEGLPTKLVKLDFLVEEGFYDKYDPKHFTADN